MVDMLTAIYKIIYNAALALWCQLRIYSFFLKATVRITTSILVILMHKIDPSATVAKHKNYFGTFNTNNSCHKMKSL